MHDEIHNELEGYLSGSAVSRSFTRHLESCQPCVQEVAEIEEVSSALHAFRLEEDSAPITAGLGFYAKVARTIEAEQKSPLWGMFAPDLQFFRKVVFASLMMLAVLGSYVVSKESGYIGAADQGQASLTEHNSTVPHDGPADRQHILVTLATYEH